MYLSKREADIVETVRSRRVRFYESLGGMISSTEERWLTIYEGSSLVPILQEGTLAREALYRYRNNLPFAILEDGALAPPNVE
jgi:hypothetical protein